MQSSIPIVLFKPKVRTQGERAKSLYIQISRFFREGPRKLKLCSIDVFLNADSESPHMT